MADLEVSLQPIYGPRFFRADGEDFFVHQVDSRSCVGPRVASKQDKTNHPKLWAAYQEAITAELNSGLVGNAPGTHHTAVPEMPGFLKRKKGK